MPFLFCGVIFCRFCHVCHFLSFVKSFFVIFLSFFVMFLSCFCRFLVVFYFLALFIFLSFSHPDQASGGKAGLGNAKKMQKMTPVWELQENAKK